MLGLSQAYVGNRYLKAVKRLREILPGIPAPTGDEARPPGRECPRPIASHPNGSMGR